MSGKSNNKELFLQNTLAMAAVLIHRCAENLRTHGDITSQVLLLECEQWFFDTRNAIEELLTQEENTEPPKTSQRLDWIETSPHLPPWAY